MYTDLILLHRYKNFTAKNFQQSSNIFMDFLQAENAYMHELLKNKDTENRAIFLQSSLAIMNMQLFLKMPQIEPYVNEFILMFELNLNRSCKTIPNEPYSGCTSLINLSNYLCHCLRPASSKPLSHNTPSSQHTPSSHNSSSPQAIPLTQDTILTPTTSSSHKSPLSHNSPLPQPITLTQDTILTPTTSSSHKSPSSHNSPLPQPITLTQDAILTHTKPSSQRKSSKQRNLSSQRKSSLPHTNASQHIPSLPHTNTSQHIPSLPHTNASQHIPSLPHIPPLQSRALEQSFTKNQNTLLSHTKPTFSKTQKREDLFDILFS